MKKLLSMFFAGLAVLLPVAISLYLVWWLFVQIDGILAPLLVKFFGRTIPGAGFLLTIIMIIMVGFMATNLIGRKLFLWSEQILLKIPLLGKIYSTVKRITRAFFSPGKKSFRQVVLVEFPRTGAYSLGFITNDEFPFVEEDTYSVFVPTTPNPTSGFFIVVPQNQVKILDISVEQGIEMLMSAGMITAEP